MDDPTADPTPAPPQPIPLTPGQRREFVGHQAREQLLAVEACEMIADVLRFHGLAPEDLGRTWTIDMQSWQLVPIAPQPAPSTPQEPKAS